MGEFNYKDSSAPKLTDEFKQQFFVNIKGKDAVKVEGLVAFANEKGIKDLKTKIIQFPSDANRWTCICETTVIGYGWDPINEKICEVQFSDIGDANETNCSAMVKSSYIRMASTRSIGRALRKYTNIDVVCSAELSDMVEEVVPAQPPITTETLLQVKTLLKVKGVGKEGFEKILISTFHDTNYMGFTDQQGQVLISVLQSLSNPEGAQTTASEQN